MQIFLVAWSRLLHRLLTKSSWRHLIDSQVLVSKLLLTFRRSNLNLSPSNLVPLCINGTNKLCWWISLLHAILLFAFSEDTLCIKEQGELLILSNSKYPEGLIIPLLSLSPFIETFGTIWNRFHSPTWMGQCHLHRVYYHS